MHLPRSGYVSVLLHTLALIMFQLLAHHVFKDLCDTDGHLPVKSFKTAVQRLRVAGLVGRIRPTVSCTIVG